MRLYPLIVIGAIVLGGCRTKPPTELDLPNTIVGAEAIEFGGRSSTRRVMSSLDLENGFTATVSHGYFTAESNEDIDFIEVMIEDPKSTKDEIFVRFRKAFALEDLPPDILPQTADEIVSITEDSIVFNLGSVTVRADKPWIQTGSARNELKSGSGSD